MNPARQGKRNVDHMLLNTLAPFGGKEKGAMCAKQERKKSADRECLAGGNKGRHCAKNQEASQASRKMPCGPAIAQKGQSVH
jgi:hypothetical protein